MDRKPLLHGLTKYQRGCRCDICTEANREAQRKYRSSHPVSKIKIHGTTHGYNMGCRCDECKLTNHDKNALRYKLTKLDKRTRPPAIAIVSVTKQEQLVLDLVNNRITEQQFIALGGTLT